jgi:hypothetical protein
MPLKKPPNYIALIDFLRSYRSVQKELNKLFLHRESEIDDEGFEDKRQIDGRFEYIAHNNPTEHFVHIEDGYDVLRHDYKKDLVEICNYFAETHYKQDQNHRIFVKKNYLEQLKLLKSSVDNFLIEGFFIYSRSRVYSNDNNLDRFIQ